MTSLIQIGNSQGIRIPKHLIAQANLENKELELVVVEEGLLLKPKKNVRSGWADFTCKGIQSGLDDQEIMCDFESSDIENEWEW